MTSKGGRKEKREARLKDIMQDAQGNPVYTGELWRIADSEKAGSGKRQRALLITGLALLALTVIGSGCIDSKNAMGSFYVVLPYIGEVSAFFGLAWNAVKILASADKIRTYTIEHVRSRIPAACRILTTFALIGLLCSAVYLIRNGAGDKLADSISYLLLKGASAVLAEWYRRTLISIKWAAV